MTRRATTGTGPIDDDLTSGSGTARDSLTVGIWTAVSRGTGLVRVVVVAAVLGPTFFGNAYQLTNTLPNLVYYGFLAGSLLSSLLVPALVQHIDGTRPHDTERVSGGFLGVTLMALLLVAPLAVLLVPELLRIATLGELAGGTAANQVSQTRLLLLLTIPQVFLYAVVGSATAVMFAHRRYAFAAAVPAIENVGIIAVLGIVAAVYGTGSHDVGPVPGGEIVLLGLGSTMAVALHAALQWWGARRCGVSIRPSAGWRDAEVRRIIRRAMNAVAQAGLLTVQLLTLLLVASRVPGGVVALQISVNFYNLPIALAAAPVALALLPRLSRLAQSQRDGEFTDTYLRALRLALFVILPAACGYVVLAEAIAHTVAAGAMATAIGTAMISASLAALALGLVGEAIFLLATQAAYSRGDTRTPLISMSVQTGVCLALCGVSTIARGDRLLAMVGASYALAALFGGFHLLLHLRRYGAPTEQRLWPTLLRSGAGVAVMLPSVHLCVQLLTAHFSGRTGWTFALAVGSVVGVVMYWVTQSVLQAPELSWVVAGLRRRPSVRDRVRRDRPRSDQPSAQAETRERVLRMTVNSSGPRTTWRLLRTYAWMVLAVAGITVLSALLLTAARPTTFTASARVVINPDVTESGAPVTPTMGTERDVVMSGLVASRAAAQLGIPEEQTLSSLSVSVPVDTAVLVISYTADTAQEAFRGAQVFSTAYVTYRNSHSRVPVAELTTPATPPTRATPHNYLLIGGLATIFGLLVGVGCALLWDRVADRLRSVRDLETHTGLPVLASIPHVRHGTTPTGLVDPDETAEAVGVLTVRLTSLMERRGMSLMLTGASPGAGTSTVAAQIAVALARMGKPVVLVCANVRTPILRTWFEVSSTPGFTEVVTGVAKAEKALHDTEVPGLRLVPSGAAFDADAVTWRLDEVHNVIGELSGDAIVVIDAPPAGEGAHAGLLAYAVDHIVVVADLAGGRRSEAERAVVALDHARDKIIGCVANMADHSRRSRAARREAAVPATDPVPHPLQ